MGRGSLRARSGGLLALPQLCFRLTPAAPGLAEVPPVSWAHVGLLCARQALVHSCVWITFLYTIASVENLRSRVMIEPEVSNSQLTSCTHEPSSCASGLLYQWSQR